MSTRVPSETQLGYAQFTDDYLYDIVNTLVFDDVSSANYTTTQAQAHTPRVSSATQPGYARFTDDNLRGIVDSLIFDDCP